MTEIPYVPLDQMFECSGQVHVTMRQIVEEDW
ncbi:MAG: hypothetical protein ETSY2_13300 [Candidatus Entotheonella gemina]|uniref:Uncharacterized protein n=1 Tax=Candidatus Entotheonella gemina TaxID=1429439 RepID=W4M9K8_9BACT|nr:MAG: hypothetical protein ETSY2_13300 [Candidatus Entotheonella gemina]